MSPILILGTFGLIGAVVLMTNLLTEPAVEVSGLDASTPVALSGPALGPAPTPSPSASIPGGDPEPPAPVWSRAAWAEHMRAATAFELRAVSSVQVATRRYWPKLGVSCASGTTSVYVMTGGGAKIEADTSDYIVDLTLDGAPLATQRWLPADDYQAIFAADPIDLVRQIAQSSTLRVEYAHYQSGQVVVEFDVRGAHDVVASVARRCRWQLAS